MYLSKKKPFIEQNQSLLSYCKVTLYSFLLVAGVTASAIAENPFDGMSAVDIAVQAESARLDEPQASPVGVCSDSIDEAMSINFMKFEFAKLTGRAGHQSLTPDHSQPIPGSKDAIAELWGSWATAEFRLVDETGELIENILMDSTDDEFARMYWAGSVDIPNSPFSVAVSGTDANGVAFDLTCSYTFYPQTIAVEFDVDFQRAQPGPAVLNAVVTNHGPADTFDLVFSNDMNVPNTGSPPQVVLTQGESTSVQMTVDIPAISTGVLDIRAKLTAQGTTNSSVSNHGNTLLRLERFNFMFGDGFDASNTEAQ